uniref:Uncharacterized protein n=1 Tax=Spyridia filamentosa TaxID=196632 RepID=A0A1Z1MJK5_SPYFI|nr:hypothetical protein [Spyridia filamentosa]ARW66238.1 hypothetical protein [Spyridia filamentosa]
MKLFYFFSEILYFLRNFLEIKNNYPKNSDFCKYLPH